jgi:hypothetical protein
MAHFSEQLQGVVAIDGKVLRRSFDRAGGKSALHMVSVWGSEQWLVLALIAGAAQPSGSTALGNRKQPALAAGRGDERGSGSNANGHGAHNLAVLRHMVLNAMQKEGSKGSLRG